MYIERVRFLLVNYLRIRLKKIEKQAHYIIVTRDELEKLSPAEQLYLTKLVQLQSEHCDAAVLSRLPTQLKQRFHESNDLYFDAQPNLEVSWLWTVLWG
jgi:hypothetical protein